MLKFSKIAVKGHFLASRALYWLNCAHGIDLPPGQTACRGVAGERLIANK